MRLAQAWVFQRNPRPAQLQSSVTSSTVCEAIGAPNKVSGATSPSQVGHLGLGRHFFQALFPSEPSSLFKESS